MQTALSFPPLTPFLGGVASTSPWGAAAFMTPMSSFVLPSLHGLPVPMAISRQPTPSPRVPRHHHQHDNHHSPVLPSPTGSPRLRKPTVQHTASAAALPPLRPWLPSTAVTAVGTTEQGMLLAFRPPAGYQMPAMPCWGSVSLPTSPVSSAPSSPTNAGLQQSAKRKRAASVPPTGERSRTLTQATQQTKSEVTFANGAQVSKWKLNGPRYKRCKVTDANGADQWKKCHHCGTDSTPEWRNGPLGKGTLCNACGLRYRSKQREQTSRGQSGNVPVSLLLNPESNKKGRTNINNPMIWETKLASFPASSQDHQQQQHVRLE